MAAPTRGYFTPRFILPNELRRYGLPDAKKTPGVLNLVDAASALIDSYCGRIDGDGLGSLVYTTYMERLLLQARNRNILRVSFKPMSSLTPDVTNNLQASANGSINKDFPDITTNYFWTGVQPNTILRPDTTLSPIIGCSGRYGYARRSEFAIYPDLNYGMNLLQVASFFGGPPGFTPIDASAIDFDPKTGEIWVPAGLYLSQYTEIVIIYNSGYDPLNMPPQIKQATAMLVRNFLARGGGTTGIKAINAAGTANVQFTDDMIDDTIARILSPYVNLIAY